MYSKTVYLNIVFKYIKIKIFINISVNAVVLKILPNSVSAQA